MVARLLVECGVHVNIDLEDNKGRTAFHFVSERGHHDFARRPSDLGSNERKWDS